MGLFIYIHVTKKQAETIALATQLFVGTQKFIDNETQNTGIENSEVSCRQPLRPERVGIGRAGLKSRGGSVKVCDPLPPPSRYFCKDSPRETAVYLKAQRE
jgi:hypothetical protein